MLLTSMVLSPSHVESATASNGLHFFSTLRPHTCSKSECASETV